MPETMETQDPGEPTDPLSVEMLIQQLSRPGAYGHPVDEVTVVQTHISVVFLAGDFVYKVKKPVDLGFLDFTTLERRERFCRQEVRLNRRLAPDVYLGVCPIVRDEGSLRIVGEIDVDGEFEPSLPPAEPGGAPGEEARHPVEWAVRMTRLPDDRRMASWVGDGTLRPYHVAVVARRIARFHAAADSGPDVSRWGRLKVVAGNAQENLEQAEAHVGRALTPELHRRLTAALERELGRFGPLIEKRAAAGIPRDTHGDLHLDHIYLFGDRDPPGDVVIIDCIEFNERFRFADPVSDVAFLDMDLRFQGRDDLARVLGDAYFDAANDSPGRPLLPFYSAYRAAVRAKVGGMKAAEPEVPEDQRERAVHEARSHWLLALRLLEPPRRRPCLVLVGGLPGTGKSTLAELLAAASDFDVFSSDPTRKRLAGLDPETSAAAAYGEGLYTSEWNDRTYAALLEIAEGALLDGGRVIVDASFREDARRAQFLSLASRLRVPSVFLRLEAPAARVRERLETRPRGASDADTDTFEAVAARWEPPSPETEPSTRVVHTGQAKAWSLEQALVHLEGIGVHGPHETPEPDREASNPNAGSRTS